jgi:transposase
MLPKLTKEQFKRVYDSGFEPTFALFDALQDAVIALEQRVTHVEAILAKDSHNSSKPPSSDGFKRPPQSLRGKSDKRAGGQNGHDGATLLQSDTPNHIEIHRCQGDCKCGKSLDRATVIDIARRQVLNYPEIKIEITEHQAHTLLCSCGVKHKADFPEGINAPVQYGNTIKALGVYLIVQQLLPTLRVQQIIKDLLGIDLSQATLQNFTKEGSAALEPTVDAIKEKIVNSPVAHADETGCDVNKGLWWIHSLSTLDYTFYHCDEHRGLDAVAVADLIAQFRGRLIHDGWKSYLHYVCEHGLCNAHHLRELVFIDEHLKEKWAQKMKDHLLAIKAAVEDACNRGRKSLPESQKSGFRRRYLGIIREGLAMQPPPIKRKQGQRGKIKQTPGKNLLDRLRTHIDETLAFMYDFSVPFTNNLAERDLRMVKVKLKVSGCFRTSLGARVFCRIRSFLSTLRKQKLTILHNIQKMFEPNSKNVSLLPV